MAGRGPLPSAGRTGVGLAAGSGVLGAPERTSPSWLCSETRTLAPQGAVAPGCRVPSAQRRARCPLSKRSDQGGTRHPPASASWDLASGGQAWGVTGGAQRCRGDTSTGPTARRRLGPEASPRPVRPEHGSPSLRFPACATSRDAFSSCHRRAALDRRGRRERTGRGAAQGDESAPGSPSQSLARRFLGPPNCS